MSSRSTFETVKRVAAVLIAIAVVLAAGIVVGQAPSIFGVEENPEASITFEDQQQDGTSVTIETVTLSDGGFIVITDSSGEQLAVSEYLEAGTHENVTVEQKGNETKLIGQLTATVHQDTNADEAYAYTDTDGEEDQPYLKDGYPVSDTATVTTAEGAVTDSFMVTSISAPETATTNETIKVVAKIRNPTNFKQQQNVEFRLNGTVIERQVLELEGGESRTVTFNVDTSGTPPGTQPFGVYTDADGALDEITLEFHTEPYVTVTDADNETVTVDTATPESGFVAVEKNGTVLGTSGKLEPGEHKNITVSFDENATVDRTDELTAVVYTGSPDNVNNASPLRHGGDLVQTRFTIANTESAKGSDGNETDGGGG